jgi:putative salt-induced outer membrane protein
VGAPIEGRVSHPRETERIRPHAKEEEEMKRWILAAGVLLLLHQAAHAAEEKKKEGWQTHAELGYVKTGGNTDTQNLAAKLATKLEADKNRYLLSGGGLFAETDGTQTTNKIFGAGRYDRFLTERMFGFLAADYLKDKFSGYNYRFGIGPGLGYDIIKTNEHKLTGLVGVIYNYDKFSDGMSDPYWAGRAGIDYAWQILKNLKFKQIATYNVSFKDTKTWFIDSETGLEAKISSNLSLGLSYLVNYKNHPPGDFKKTDTTFLTSVIVDF